MKFYEQTYEKGGGVVSVCSGKRCKVKMLPVTADLVHLWIHDYPAEWFATYDWKRT